MQDESRFVSRRRFLTGALVGTAGIWIQATLPRPLAAAEARTDREPRALEPREWKLVESITGRILPTDDTPGAIEAGCVNFIDKALANEDASVLPLYRMALRELDRLSATSDERIVGAVPGAAHPGFVELETVAQDRILAELETGAIAGWNEPEASPSAFFETLRMHTILGFVLDPSYGGNRDHVGWKTMGFPGPVHHLGGSRPTQMLGEEAFVPVWERRGQTRPDHEG